MLISKRRKENEPSETGSFMGLSHYSWDKKDLSHDVMRPSVPETATVDHSDIRISRFSSLQYQFPPQIYYFISFSFLLKNIYCVFLFFPFLSLIEQFGPQVTGSLREAQQDRHGCG